MLNLLASFFKQCLSVCLACCNNELHCLCLLWGERPTGCLWHSRRLALMWFREFPLHFFVGGESVLMYKAFHWQMLSIVDFLGISACSSSVKSSLLFWNACACRNIFLAYHVFPLQSSCDFRLVFWLVHAGTKTLLTPPQWSNFPVLWLLPLFPMLAPP